MHSVASSSSIFVAAKHSTTSSDLLYTAILAFAPTVSIYILPPYPLAEPIARVVHHPLAVQ